MQTAKSNPMVQYWHQSVKPQSHLLMLCSHRNCCLFIFHFFPLITVFSRALYISMCPPHLICVIIHHIKVKALGKEVNINKIVTLKNVNMGIIKTLVSMSGTRQHILATNNINTLIKREKNVHS